MEQKSISEFTLVELKALAYDQMAQIELSQNNLKIINQEFSRRLNDSNQGSIPQGINGISSNQNVDPLPPGSIQTL